MSEKKPLAKRGIDIESVTDDQTGGKSYFLGIGIDEYKTFPKLHNAVKDVKDILSVLQNRYHIDHAHLIFNTEATREEIITQLDRLVKTIQPEDKLLIYYSGHGHLDKAINKGYWIPIDAKKDNTVNYIRNSTIKEYIEVIKAKHILLISDSCFSGSLFLEGSTRSTAAIEELEQRISRWAFCSGRHDEEVFDGKPGENSPFAASIIYNLFTNTKGSLNIGNLVNQVIESTRANYEQLPEGNPMYGVGHKGGQYIFQLKQSLIKENTPVSENIVKPDLPSVTLSGSEEQSLGKGILKWIGFFLLYLIGAACLYFIFDVTGIPEQFVADMVPFVIFPAPLFAAYFSKLRPDFQWILLAIFAILLYILMWNWIVINGNHSALFYLFWLIAGLTIYFFSLRSILRIRSK